MSITVIAIENGCRLVFGGDLTFDFAPDLEDRVIDALRRYTYFELDLSGVQKIDSFGIHILGLLMGFGDDRVKIVSNLQLVEQAYEKFFACRRGTWLRGSPEERNRCSAKPLAF